MKIIIIKLGADGDVLRTLPVIKVLKQTSNVHITLVTRENISELLKGIAYIDSILTTPIQIKENFDRLYNFDIDDEATALASSINAGKKYGFYSSGGYVAAFNLGAEYYINTIFDDQMKKSNKKTYQEMMFEAAEVPCKKERYEIVLNSSDKEYAHEFMGKNHLDGKKIIGIHMGASPRWPSKVWHESKVIEFIRLALTKKYEIILFGGPNEVDKHQDLVAKLAKYRFRIHRNNPNNTKRQFASLVELCQAVVCSDSFALHVSIGLGKKTICLFFCTPPNEVESYGLLTKIISPRLYEFFPEKMDKYDDSLVQTISAIQVLSAIEHTNGNK